MRRVGFVLVALVLAVPSCGAKASSGGGLQTIDVVTPAAFTAKVASFRGKPLVVNFWATWCDPCKAEMPRLAAAAKTYAGRVAFLGVDVQDDSAFAARFARREHVSYMSVADPRRDVVQSQHILGLPVTQFYDAAGKQRSVHQGEIKPDQLRAAIEKLL